MARSVRKAWNNGNGGGGSDDELQKRAAENVKERHEADRQNLLKLQGLEIKHLDSERAWIGKERSRDVAAFNQREITAINQRYDRQQHDLERRHNRLWGKISRVFGGHKRQQARMNRLTAERDRIVGDRTKQHVNREAQRQRSLTERDMRVVKDLQEAREKHSQARDTQRQQQEQGFDFAVKQEMNRLRVRGPRMGM